MIIKEIANAVNKDETSIRRWIKKLSGISPGLSGISPGLSDTSPGLSDTSSGLSAKTAGISAKMGDISTKMAEAQTTKKAADFTIDETIEIIKAGLGKNAAELFRANARNFIEKKKDTKTDWIINELTNNRNELSDIKKALCIITKSIPVKKNNTKLLEANKEKPIIVKRIGENVHVKWRNKLYLIAPSYYRISLLDIRAKQEGRNNYFTIKKDLMNEHQALKFIENNF